MFFSQMLQNLSHAKNSSSALGWKTNFQNFQIYIYEPCTSPILPTQKKWEPTINRYVLLWWSVLWYIFEGKSIRKKNHFLVSNTLSRYSEFVPMSWIVDKGACCQFWQGKSDSWDPHGQREEPIPESCPLTSAHAIIHTK